MIADLSKIDPAIARAPEDYIALLRQVRSMSTLSYWEIEERARELGFDLEPTELVEALGGDELPTRKLVIALLVTCGFAPHQIDRWMDIHERLSDVESWPVAPPPDPVPEQPRRVRRGLVLAAAVALGVTAIAVTAVLLRKDPEIVTGTPPIPAPATEPGSATPGGPSAAVPSPSATPSPSPSTRPSTRPSPTPTDAPATLNLNQGLDLDTGQLSPGAAGPSNVYDVVAMAGGMRSGDYNRRLALMPPGPAPTKEQCSALTANQLDMLVAVGEGRSLCVLTTQGKWARLTVLGTQGGNVQLIYLVWS